MSSNSSGEGGTRSAPTASFRKSKRRRKWILLACWSLGTLSLVGGTTAWLGARASDIQAHLNAATGLVPQLKSQVSADDSSSAAATVDEIRKHTSAARDSTNDPLWSLASSFPGIGQNFRAVSEIAQSANDVASLGLVPLLNVYQSLDWNTLVPTASGVDLQPLASASPSISSSAHAVRISLGRLEAIDASNLLPQIAEPLVQARAQLNEAKKTLDAAASASQILPSLLGSNGSRSYLLMVQNNAELRATGGIPGALAVLTVDNGKLSLGAQSSATDVGIMSPILAVDEEQKQIFTGRMGKFMQDVNLTPDFPTAASTAQSMWERHSGEKVDGVLSIDPVALSYILDATGPINLTEPELIALAGKGLPTKLDGKNVVQTLLSDVYANIEDPKLQDAYFAGVAQQAFAALSDGKGDPKGLIEGLTKGADEGRVLVWSADVNEQAIIDDYAVSGSISGPNVQPAQFGAYFNDGTGAKMDFHVKRTVQLIKQCTNDGYEQTTVRVTSTNAASKEAATSLPDYVTGGGIYGVPAGSVQTNILSYGPVQSVIETAAINGQRTPFAPHIHSNRPVGVLAVLLAPGETKTVDFTFGKIVQHSEPNIAVTPTVQPVKDVILPTEKASCGDG